MSKKKWNETYTVKYILKKPQKCTEKGTQKKLGTSMQIKSKTHKYTNLTPYCTCKKQNIKHKQGHNQTQTLTRKLIHKKDTCINTPNI